MPMPSASSRRRFLVAAMLFVIVVINFLDRSNLSIVAPQLSGSLHLDPIRMGLVFSGFGWTYAALQIPAGWLVDRIHPRLLYCAVLALWSIGTFALGLAGSFAMLFALRLAVGAFESPAYPINNRVVTTWFGEKERAGAIGFYTSGQFVGLAFLTPLLSWIDVAFGWRWVFGFTGFIGLLWAFVWLVFYRDPKEFRGVNQAEIDWIAASGGIPDLSDRLVHSERFAWSDLWIVLSRRKLWGIYIGQFGLVSTQWFFLTWFPTYLIKYRHFDFIQSGLLASIPFFGAFLGVLAGGFLSNWMLRRGCTLTKARKVPIIFGLLLSGVMVGANYVSSPISVIACLTCAFFGSGFASITWSLVSTIAPERLIGLTGGVFNFSGGLAAILVPLVIGFLIRNGSFAMALVFVSLMALLGALSYIGLVGGIERVDG
ncbi:MAG TPA: MFS transporter [Acidobacteriaceae bacterium]|nr:MFS transporter [Acidobacteriaceae bacterium]